MTQEQQSIESLKKILYLDGKGYKENKDETFINQHILKIGKHKEFEVYVENKKKWSNALLLNFHPYNKMPKKIVIPSEITDIRDYAFSKINLCKTAYYEIDASRVSRLWPKAFSQLTRVKKIILGNKIKEIPVECFAYCLDLEEVVIPNGVEIINNEAFVSLHFLKSLKIPASVKKIGESLFWRCFDLEKIEVDPKNKIYNSKNNCNAIIETKTKTLIYGCLGTKIPQTVEKIAKKAFGHCRYLTSINFPKHLKEICECAFAGCYCLSRIDPIPKGCKVHKRAFFECINLYGRKCYDVE